MQIDLAYAMDLFMCKSYLKFGSSSIVYSRPADNDLKLTIYACPVIKFTVRVTVGSTGTRALGRQRWSAIF